MRPHGVPNGSPRATGAGSTQDQQLVVRDDRQLMLEASQDGHLQQPLAVLHGEVAPGALSALLLAAAADSWCFSTSSEMIRRLQPPLVHVDRRHLHLQH